MNQPTLGVSRPRHLLAGWTIAACGTFAFGVGSLSAADAHRHQHQKAPEHAGAVVHEHSHSYPPAPHHAGSLSLQEADTTGLWHGYRRGDCPSCHSATSHSGTASCGCADCECGEPKNPVYRVLDGLAGGIERVLRLDDRRQRRHEAVCDDGCDGLMLQELQHLEAGPMPMVWPTAPALKDVPPADADSRSRSSSRPPRPTSEPAAPEKETVPAPIHPDSKVNPFEDEEAWMPGRNPAIKRSAYFE